MPQVVDCSLPCTYNIQLVKHSNQTLSNIMEVRCESSIYYMLLDDSPFLAIKCLFNNVDLHEPPRNIAILKVRMNK